MLGIALYLPSLALTEVRAVRPDAAPLLADLLTHPSVVLGELDAAMADQVEQLLLDARMFDAMAGHVVHVARAAGMARAGRPPTPQPATPALDGCEIDYFATVCNGVVVMCCGWSDCLLVSVALSCDTCRSAVNGG